ncbi:hypothetical protein DL546_004940 [Coniochaeta pulveracea]|uniref:Uncharacterized protein n=1 Tax=Coniochaeta pulveracea TaxID=177199 RepID=A0A420Y9B9_9PEZI|nr:hypothetical protein DL546_004940 [Coniochaeta pulveracea]
MSASDSYLFDHSPSTDNDDIDSLPSTISSGTDSTDSEFQSDAQKEWEQSIDQLQLLLTMVIIPFAGKLLGRKFAYWSWARYMEWMHNVEVRFTSKKTFNAAGVAGAAL